jgi:hypothetical protein
VIDVRYRTPAARSTPTDLYHAFGSRSLAVQSRCKMTPTDSEAFAIRAERCGGLAAWYWGVSRLLLEQASSPRYTAPIREDNRLRWIDLPGLRCN